jgi:sulfite exporter TauE/SafE
MCGGFSLYLSKSSSVRGGFVRGLLFVLGKMSTYAFLGALAAALGAIIFRNTPLEPYARLMRIGAGAITIAFGLAMLGLRFTALKMPRVIDSGLIRSLFGGLSATRNPFAGLVLGLGAGFLPCPLPLGMLAIAAGSHSIPAGIALMVGVGAGTAPGLLAAGLVGAGLNRRFSQLGARAAGIVVLAIGILIVGRNVGILNHAHSIDKIVPSCCGPAADHPESSVSRSSTP